MHNGTSPDGKNPENLTRYQATLLQQLPLSLADLQKKKQTTVCWCYKRNLLEIHKGVARRTPFGDLCLKALRSADVDRKEAKHYGDFCEVIRSLAEVARYERIRARQKHGFRIVDSSAA